MLNLLKLAGMEIQGSGCITITEADLANSYLFYIQEHGVFSRCAAGKAIIRPFNPLSRKPGNRLAATPRIWHSGLLVEESTSGAATMLKTFPLSGAYQRD